MHSLFNNIRYLFFVFVMLISACKKADTTINKVPILDFVSVTPNDVHEFQQALVFTVHYKDGDGDLGENNPDAKNLFLIDNRIGIKYQYRLQQLSPSNSTIAIDGDFNVELKTVALTDSSLVQNATFSIYVVDRAGNQSNTVTSSNVIIRK